MENIVLDLYAASAPEHDGEIDGKKAQIKISQQNKIAIYHEPEYLIVLYLTKSGDIFEVYNGPGREPWNRAGKMDRHMTVNQLMELDGCVSDENRIHPIHLIEKVKAEYKNKKKPGNTNMNIQIFGTKKSFDSKKAERYFKERGIKYQFIDMKEKGLSKGEFNSASARKYIQILFIDN
jgi:hypothetical protein